MTKDFLQFHINKLIIDKKIINKINRNNNSHKVNIESLDGKDRRFPASSNDFPSTSIVTSLNQKTPSIDVSLLIEHTQKSQTNR